MVCVVAQPKGGVGKTTTAINVSVLLAHRGERVLVVDADPQSTLTRQLGLDVGAPAVSLVDVLARRATAHDAVVTDVHGVDVIAGAPELAGVEMSLAGEIGRERFLHAALDPVAPGYEHIVIDTPANLGLLTVNALICSDIVLAPVNAEDVASVQGLVELRAVISELRRLRWTQPRLLALLTRWQPERAVGDLIEQALISLGSMPVARIPSRAAFGQSAAAQVPLALTVRDSSVTLAYQQLIDHLVEGVSQ